LKGRRFIALALIALTLGGCGSKADDSGKPRSQMSPASALDAAIDDLGRSTYAVEITSNGAGRESGVIDPTAGVGTLNSTAVQGVPARMDAVMVRPDIWVKLDLGDRNRDYGIRRKAWMKLDAAKAANTVRLPFDQVDFSDALNMKRLLAGVDAKRADPQRLTGVIDLTRSSGVTAPDPSDVAGAGAVARHVPVTITLDEQGRLVEVNIGGDAVGPRLSVDIRFSDYGMSARVTRPNDDQVVPTPDSVYQLLSGQKPA
jgi:hypothetical protein